MSMSSDDYYLQDCEVREILEAKESESTVDAAKRQMAREEANYQAAHKEISELRRQRDRLIFELQDTRLVIK